MAYKQWFFSFLLSAALAIAFTMLRLHTPIPFLSRFSVPYVRDQSGVFLGPVGMSHPIMAPILSPLWSNVILSVFPTVYLIVTQLWVRSMWDLFAAMGGAGLSTSLFWAVFAVFKYIYIWPKETFLHTCAPIQPMMDGLWRAVPEYERSPRMWFDPFICHDFTSATSMHASRYYEMREALTAFPSGRVSIVWLAGWFLALYLNNLCGPFGRNAYASLWLSLPVVSPIAVASVLTCFYVMQQDTSLTIAVATALLVLPFVVVGYMGMYVGLWDKRPKEYSLFPEPKDEEEGIEMTSRDV